MHCIERNIRKTLSIDYQTQGCVKVVSFLPLEDFYPVLKLLLSAIYRCSGWLLCVGQMYIHVFTKSSAEGLKI